MGFHLYQEERTDLVKTNIHTIRDNKTDRWIGWVAFSSEAF